MKGLVELIVSGVNGFDELIVVEELIGSSGSHRWFQGEASDNNQEPDDAHIISQIPSWLICSSSVSPHTRILSCRVDSVAQV